MKNTLFLLLTASLFFVSCQSSNEKDEVALFNNLSFKLLDQEENVKPNNFDFETYTEIQAKIGLQIPIYKVIKHEQYKIFIGMPYNTTFDEITKEIESSGDKGQIVDKGVDAQIFTKKLSDEHKTYSIVVYGSNKNLLYVLASQNTDSESLSLTDPNELIKRISKSE